ncbi:MAG: hypothetical protein Q8P57_04500, partial [Candidatus Pacearchaeota archaeon]|nr:hypothetical protein [Candidatus Pacearchaeota archaeon]
CLERNKMANHFELDIKPIKIEPIGFGFVKKKKRKTLSSGDKIYIWERPKNMEEYVVFVTKK